ncbi:thiol peroxidase [Dermabacteraceae bacterium TAE3-ERU27]|nr:thiol peroxidase [Dermabacteraceae bacterium TAE3-ERU27]
MAKTVFHGNEIDTCGELPAPGSKAPGFTLISKDLKPVSLADYAGRTVILNIFPSVDTGVCATSVRTFNREAAGRENVSVLCVSRDLPFAQARFCGAEGIENVEVASDFQHGFGEAYGITMAGGPLAGLLARGVVVVGPDGTVRHSELVAEVSSEPNYEAALVAADAE